MTGLPYIETLYRLASTSNAQSASGDRSRSMALLLLLFLVESLAIDHQCSNIHANFRCTNNSMLTVTKSTEMYLVTLQANERQCFNDFCLVNNQEHWQKTLMCNDICGACRRLQPRGSNDCGTIVTNCEVQLDVYLDEFCAQAISTSNRATINTSAMVSAELPCPTTTVHSIQLTTITVSSTLPCQYNKAKPMTSVTLQTNTPSLATDSQILAKSVENYMYLPVTALGVLLALSLLLLAVVTTGWVCTCMLMKKREAKKRSTHSRVANFNDDTDDKDNEERFIHNPTYDDTHASTTTQLACETEATLGPVGALVNDKNFAETAYDTINLPTQPAADNGQTYDVLNRSQANGSNLATEVGRVRDNENYSQLGLQEK